MFKKTTIKFKNKATLFGHYYTHKKIRFLILINN